MAHPPQATAAASRDDQRLRLDADPAHAALRADGLNAVERSVLDAAEDENRAEEAEIFERAAAKFRPSWAGADEEVVSSVQPSISAPAPVAAPAASPHPFDLPQVVQGYAAVSLPAAIVEDEDEVVERVSPLARFSRLFEAVQRRRVAIGIAAASCVALGGIWAAFSGHHAPAAPAPAATESAPVEAAPASATVAAPAVVTPVAAPAPTPAPVAKQVEPVVAKKPVAPMKAKAGMKKPMAKAPAKKAPLAKNAKFKAAPAKPAPVKSAPVAPAKAAPAPVKKPALPHW